MHIELGQVEDAICRAVTNGRAKFRPVGASHVDNVWMIVRDGMLFVMRRGTEIPAGIVGELDTESIAVLCLPRDECKVVLRDGTKVFWWELFMKVRVGEIAYA